MKPNDFWNCTYKEALLFVNSNSLQREKEMKEKIILLDKFGDKMIEAFNFKKPKYKSLVKDTFKELFEEELKPQEQSVEEQLRIIRSWND